MANNTPWMKEWARFLKEQIEESYADRLPSVDTAEVISIHPFIVIKPGDGDVSYDEDDIVWGIDNTQLAVGDVVLLTRDPTDSPIVTALLDGNNPDPTTHPAGEALANQLQHIHSQSRFWKAPVANLTALNATIIDGDGTVRLVLSEDKLYRYDAASSTWTEISGSAGPGGSDSFATRMKWEIS